MTIALGGITLSDHLVLDGIENAPRVSMQARRTVAGTMIVTTLPLVGGWPLALQSENHLTLAQIVAVKALEASGQSVTLVHPRGTFSVYVTGVEVDPDTAIVNPEDAADLWYSGTINLLTR